MAHILDRILQLEADVERLSLVIGSTQSSPADIIRHPTPPMTTPSPVKMEPSPRDVYLAILRERAATLIITHPGAARVDIETNLEEWTQARAKFALKPHAFQREEYLFHTPEDWRGLIQSVLESYMSGNCN